MMVMQTENTNIEQRHLHNLANFLNLLCATANIAEEFRKVYEIRRVGTNKPVGDIWLLLNSHHCDGRIDLKGNSHPK